MRQRHRDRACRAARAEHRRAHPFQGNPSRQRSEESLDVRVRTNPAVVPDDDRVDRADPSRQRIDIVHVGHHRDFERRRDARASEAQTPRAAHEVLRGRGFERKVGGAHAGGRKTCVVHNG
jgi:hypothetical protein